MDDGGGTRVDFLHHALALGGVAKRASIPLASAESRWWESGALGGKNGAMVGRREGREDEREGRGAEVQKQSPGEEKNKWLGETRCLCSSCSELVYLGGGAGL